MFVDGPAGPWWMDNCVTQFCVCNYKQCWQQNIIFSVIIGRGRSLKGGGAYPYIRVHRLLK